MSGTRLMRCRYCNATGQAHGGPCGGCKGEGYLTVGTDSDGAAQQCSTCNGTGVFRRKIGTYTQSICSACGGSGWAGVMKTP